MAKVRLGVALLIPPPWANEIDGLRRALGDGARGRIPPHLTLVPPVNVRDDRLPDALEVLREAAVVSRPIDLELGPPTTFLPVTPVLYLPLLSPTDDVQTLRNRVFQGPLARPLTHSFVPHVTLADEAAPARIAAAQEALADFCVTPRVDRVHLLQEGEGRVWHPIADAAFAAPWVAGRGGLETELAVTHVLDPDASTFAARAWSAYSISTYGVDPPVDSVAVTARRERTVVGVATGEVTAQSGYLGRLIVEDHVRHEGIGAHLLTAFEQACRDRGADRLTLRTLDGGAAESFYRNRGYTTLCGLPHWRLGRDFVQLVRSL